MTDQPEDINPSDLVLPLDELFDMASVTEEDVAEAVEWWRAHASEAWKGAIDEQE